MSYRGILKDAEALEDAIEALPRQCLYHGVHFEMPIGGDDQYDGACCQSGKPALYRQRAEAALERLREHL